MHGHPRRIADPTVYEYLKGAGIVGMNQFMTISAFCLGLTQLIFAYNFFYSLFAGPKAGDNPWHSNTLEWTTTVAAAVLQLRARSPTVYHAAVRVQRAGRGRRLPAADRAPPGRGRAARPGHGLSSTHAHSLQNDEQSSAIQRRSPTDLRPNTPTPRPRAGPHWAAVLAAVLTWPLVFAGGLVTTYRVGMAVPDWPTTFGQNMFTYDLAEAAFGVRVEHIHRLAGAAVGLCTIALMLDFLAFDRRKSVKALGVLALIAVVAQGILGGMRVRNNSTTLAMIHGCTGQAFFAFMVGLAAITARSWFAARRPVEGDGRLKLLAAATLVVASFQIALGRLAPALPGPGPLDEPRGVGRARGWRHRADHLGGPPTQG